MQIRVDGDTQALAAAYLRVPKPGDAACVILGVRLRVQPFGVLLVQDTQSDSYCLSLQMGMGATPVRVVPVGETAEERWLFANSDHFVQQGAGFVQVCFVPRTGEWQEAAKQVFGGS